MSCRMSQVLVFVLAATVLLLAARTSFPAEQKVVVKVPGIT